MRCKACNDILHREAFLDKDDGSPEDLCLICLGYTDIDDEDYEDEDGEEE